MPSSGPGVYGKLPAHGDFIQRNLASSFIGPWDEWLQHFIAGSKEQLGDEWLDMYLTSPIWRFALSDGVVDADRWAGILMPSVDQVGRYFPFTVAIKLADDENPAGFLAEQSAWYAGVEELALLALDGEIALDDMAAELTTVELAANGAHVATGTPIENALHMELAADAQSSGSAYPCLLDALLAKLHRSYSVWGTTGSERVTPCVFEVSGLPPAAKLPAMIDGRWQEWGWQQPYALR